MKWGSGMSIQGSDLELFWYFFGEPFKMIMTAEQLKPASVEELQQNLSNERVSGRSKGFFRSTKEM